MKTIKVVINKCYGGFSLSKKATKFLAERGHKEAIEYLSKYNKKDYWNDFSHIERDDPLLISVIETLGEEANGGCADLEIKEIEFDVASFIEDYNGYESLKVPCFKEY